MNFNAFYRYIHKEDRVYYMYLKASGEKLDTSIHSNKSFTDLVNGKKSFSMSNDYKQQPRNC